MGATDGADPGIRPRATDPDWPQLEGADADLPKPVRRPGAKKGVKFPNRKRKTLVFQTRGKSPRSPIEAQPAKPPKDELHLSRFREDFDFYAPHVLRILPMDREWMPLRFNPAQLLLHRALERQRVQGLPMRAIVLKSRQTGISTYVQARGFHTCHMREGRKFLTLAHKLESAKHLFDMSRGFHDHLPKQGVLSDRKRIANRREIQFDNGSTIQVEVVGEVRSYTCDVLHLSETAFWLEPQKTMRSIRQTVPRRPNTIVVIESTPNGLNYFHDLWVRAVRGKSGYAPVFIAWFNDTESLTVDPWFTENDLDPEERRLMDQFGVTLRQLAWRRMKIEDDCDGDLDAFNQEFPSDPETCFLSSSRPVFDTDGMAFQTANMIPDEDLETKEISWSVSESKPVIETVRKGRLVIFDNHPIPRHSYILGIDPSEGDAQSDRSPIAVLDQMTLAFAGFWVGRAPPDLLARHAFAMGHLFNEGQLIWEANLHGGSFGLAIQELGYFNIWMRRVNSDTVAGRITDKPGYMNTRKSRAILYDTMRKFIRERISAVRHPELVSELGTLIFDGDQPRAQRGYLDDLVVAAALCLVAHRGAADAPLEPLPMETLRAAHARVAWKLEIGHKLRPDDIADPNVTCEDIEKYDELMERRERRARRRAMT